MVSQIRAEYQSRINQFFLPKGENPLGKMQKVSILGQRLLI